MSKTLIGLLFITAGVIYGSLAFDNFYAVSLGWLIENHWIKPPSIDKKSLSSTLGRKPTIFLYSFSLIIIGIFILWNRHS